MRVKNCQLYAGLPICFLLNEQPREREKRNSEETVHRAKTY